MRLNREEGIVEVDCIVIACEDNKYNQKNDCLWADFDRLYGHADGQRLKSSPETPAHWEFTIEETDDEWYSDAQELVERISYTDFEELGYEYWYTVDVVDWDIDDFKAAYPEINIEEIPEV